MKNFKKFLMGTMLTSFVLLGTINVWAETKLAVMYRKPIHNSVCFVSGIRE